MPSLPLAILVSTEYIYGKQLNLMLKQNHPVLRRYDMNGRFQMQGGKNWILPK
jgi:hypothetical protein